jgi:hypothetical protein
VRPTKLALRPLLTSHFGVGSSTREIDLESREVYPLLGFKPPGMVDLQILAYFSAASWHGVTSSVVRDRLTQQEQQE